DGIRDWSVTGVQTCALPISDPHARIGRADVEDLGRIELQTWLLVQQRTDDRARHHGADRGAVLGGDSADVDAGAGRSGTRHVLRSEERRVGKEGRGGWWAAG